jgi:Cache domain
LALVVATVVPFTALLGAGLWSQWQSDQASAIAQAIYEARVLAAQIDDHIGNLENLLTGLSEAVSSNPLDREANDILLRKVKSQLPGFVAQVSVYSLDGTNIGSSGDTEAGRVNATGRAYLQQVLEGQRLSIGDVVVGRLSHRWIINFGRPLEDRAGRLSAVLVVGTWLDQFPDALRIQDLPAGTIVTVVNQKGIIVARSVDGEKWIGRDAAWRDTARHLVMQEGSQITRWTSDNVERITAFSKVRRAPWLVNVGQPTNAAFAAVASRLGWSALFIVGALAVGFAIAWILSGRVIRPLRQLGKDAARLASGEPRSARRTKSESWPTTSTAWRWRWRGARGRPVVQLRRSCRRTTRWPR